MSSKRSSSATRPHSHHVKPTCDSGKKEETHALALKVAFNHADSNHDGILEATDIKHVWESVGQPLSDVEVWDKLAKAAHAYQETQTAAVLSGRQERPDPTTRSPRHRRPSAAFSLSLEEFLVSPGILPKAYVERTQQAAIAASQMPQPVTPSLAKGRRQSVSHLATKKTGGRRKSVQLDSKGLGFTSGAKTAPHGKVSTTSALKAALHVQAVQRHAVLIGLDQYKDNRWQDTHHCVQDCRTLGILLEGYGYNVELLVTGKEQRAQPDKATICSTLAGAADREVDVLLVFLTGYWFKGHLGSSATQAKGLHSWAVCYDTDLDMPVQSVLTLQEVKQHLGMGDAQSSRHCVLLVDGLQGGLIAGTRGEGFSVFSVNGKDIVTPSLLSHRSLFSLYLIKGLGGLGQEGEEGNVTTVSLQKYCAQKLLKRSQQFTSGHFNEEDCAVLCDNVSFNKHSTRHPRQTLQGRSCHFAAQCRFSDTTALDDFGIKLADLAKRVDKHNYHRGAYVRSVGTSTLVHVAFQGHVDNACNEDLVGRWKLDVDKACDENPWVQMRQGGVDALQGGQPSVTWHLSVAHNYDVHTPCFVLSIACQSQETTAKLRDRYARKRMRELAGFTALGFRMNVTITISGSEYDMLKFDTWSRAALFPLEIVNVMSVKPVEDEPWTPHTLSLMRFNLFKEESFKRIYCTFPILIHSTGKLLNPDMTATEDEIRAHGLITEVASDVQYKTRMRFFQYEREGVMYPPWITQWINNHQLGLTDYDEHAERANSSEAKNGHTMTANGYPKSNITNHDGDTTTQQQQQQQQQQQRFHSVIIIHGKYGRCYSMSTSVSNITDVSQIHNFITNFFDGNASMHYCNISPEMVTIAQQPPHLLQDIPLHGIEIGTSRNFDTLVLDPAIDVLVLYYTRDPTSPERAKRVDAATQAMYDLAVASSQQDEVAKCPVKLVVMSSDNNEKNFFWEHHHSARSRAGSPVTAAAAAAGGLRSSLDLSTYQPPTAVSPRRAVSSHSQPVPSYSDMSSPTSSRCGSAPTEPPAFTVKLFKVNKAVLNAMHKEQPYDYWEDMFGYARRHSVTMSTIPTPANICDFLEAHTEWVPRMSLRLLLEQTKVEAGGFNIGQGNSLPSIFKGIDSVDNFAMFK